MPKATSFTPAWLSKASNRPVTGHDVFAPLPPPKKDDFPVKKIKAGPRRTIAHRGTSEIFVAVGKEIRWTDLAKLKDNWDAQTQQGSYLRGKSHGGGTDDDKPISGYRIIKTNCAHEIRQLVISPYQDFIAILTTHTVYVAILPHSSHLKGHHNEVLKLKTFMLGPTIHVTSQSSVASALWHPLGKNGSCLVTVTVDSVVRIWEFDFANRMSFDKPSLSIDLTKLIQGSSVDQDFSASKTKMNKGFSPDSLDMEVASATFGGDSGGWSSMTLWIAMQEGDVYALCPLLPEKWSPTPDLLALLSVSIVTKAALTERDIDATEEEKLASKQQLVWMRDLDMQDPLRGGEEGAETDVYTRPANPGKVPKLQGPFDIEFQQENTNEDILLSDILVIGPKRDTDDLMYGEEDSLLSDEDDHEGLSVGVICLLTNTGRVTICLDVDGVQAQWLPHSKARTGSFGLPDTPSLIAFQTLETLRPDEMDEECWPMFSTDCSSRYSFFVTCTSSISYISLAPWIFRLESEMKGTGSAYDGLAVRFANLVKGPNSTRERVFPPVTELRKPQHPLANSVILRDPDLGYFLLSASPEGAVMISFGSPELALTFHPHSPTPPPDDQNSDHAPQLYEPRLVYQPAQALEEHSALPHFVEKLRRSKYRRILHEPVNLSPATLNVMTDAHKIISAESDRIREAAAELFRRCERLQAELRDQIQEVNRVAGMVEQVVPSSPPSKHDTDEDGDADGRSRNKPSADEIVQARIGAAREKQKLLAQRLEIVRTKVIKRNAKGLSDREKAWIDEVRGLKRALDFQDDQGDHSTQSHASQDARAAADDVVDDDDDAESGQALRAHERYARFRALAREIVDETTELTGGDTTKAGKEGSSGREGRGGARRPPSAKAAAMYVPKDVRKAKMQQVNQLLTKEEELVMATRKRLHGLCLSASGA